jgi:hypothetical protein
MLLDGASGDYGLSDGFPSFKKKSKAYEKRRTKTIDSFVAEHVHL